MNSLSLYYGAVTNARINRAVIAVVKSARNSWRLILNLYAPQRRARFAKKISLSASSILRIARRVFSLPTARSAKSSSVMLSEPLGRTDLCDLSAHASKQRSNGSSISFKSKKIYVQFAANLKYILSRLAARLECWLLTTITRLVGCADCFVFVATLPFINLRSTEMIGAKGL